MPDLCLMTHQLQIKALLSSAVTFPSPTPSTSALPALAATPLATTVTVDAAHMELTAKLVAATATLDAVPLLSLALTEAAVNLELTAVTTATAIHITRLLLLFV